MTDAVTDTHALIWYLEDSPRLGAAARDAFDASDRGEADIFVPTICLVELVYLHEKGRIPTDLKARLDAELQAGRSGLILAALTFEVANSRPRAACRYPRYAGPHHSGYCASPGLAIDKPRSKN